MLQENMYRLFKLAYSCNKTFLNRNIYSTAVFCSEGNETKNAKRKVKETVELIRLIDIDNKIMGLKPKQEAEKLARKHNYTLQQVNDPRCGDIYPVFKMFSPTNLFSADENQLKQSDSKSLKRMVLNNTIGDNDLNIKLKIIRKWLSKNSEVHIAVANKSNINPKMNIMKKIQENLENEARVLNVRDTADLLKFILLPQKEKKKEAKSPEEKTDKKKSADS